MFMPIADPAISLPQALAITRLQNEAIEKVPEVVECHAIGGGMDYLMKVVATDIDHYQQVIEELLNANIGIARYFTYIVTKPVKRARGYPIQHLLARAKQRRTAEQT